MVVMGIRYALGNTNVIFILLVVSITPTSASLSSVTRVTDTNQFFLDTYIANKRSEEELLKEFTEMVGNPQNLPEWVFRFCRSIFTTNQFFQTRREYFIPTLSITRNLRAEMSRYYNSIFENYYRFRGMPQNKKDVFGKISTVFAENGIGLFDQVTKMHSMKFKLNGVSVKDLVFTCLTRDIRTGTLKQYFISSIHGRYRFIFDYNRTRGPTVLAVVEIDNKFWGGNRNEIDEKFRCQRKYMEGAKKRIRNPTCMMSDAEKLLACHKVLSTQWTLGNVNFWPNKFNVDYTCQRKDVKVTTSSQKILSDGAAKGNEVELFEDWVIGCKGKQILPLQTPKTFYFSESLEMNEYIARYPRQKELVVEFFVSIYSYDSSAQHN